MLSNDHVSNFVHSLHSSFQVFQKLPEHFPSLFKQLMEMSLDEKWKLSFKERTIILIFFNHCFNSLEVDLIRDQVQRLVSLSIWTCLPEVSIVFHQIF